MIVMFPFNDQVAISRSSARSAKKESATRPGFGRPRVRKFNRHVVDRPGPADFRCDDLAFTVDQGEMTPRMGMTGEVADQARGDVLTVRI